jgi:hypothetical protein
MYEKPTITPVIHSLYNVCMVASSYMFQHYIAIFRERSWCLLRDAELSISQKALGMLPEDGNVMPKHVGASYHT